MRISTQQFFQLNMTSLQDHAARVGQTQLQLTRGEKLLTPADDPSGATRVLALEQRIAGLQQYSRNVGQLEGNIQVEETAVAQIHSLLDDARERLIDVNNGTHNESDYATFANDLAQIRDQLQSIGNSKNANGEFMFAGTATDTQPFIRDAAGNYLYQGNQQSRSVPVAANRSVAYGDSGFELFANVFNGNQGVSARANTANSGGGVIGEVGPSQPGSYNGDHLRAVFTAADSYDLINVTTGGPVVSVSGFSPGDTITVNGVSATIDGAPALGDQFDFQSSNRQNLLTSLDNLVAELNIVDQAGAPRLTNAVNRGLENIESALEQSVVVRSRLGTRLQSLDTVKDANESFDISYRTTLSEIRDLDFTEAAVRLSDQVNALQIAQAAFARVQGLSLFEFL